MQPQRGIYAHKHTKRDKKNILYDDAKQPWRKRKIKKLRSQRGVAHGGLCFNEAVIKVCAY